MTSKPIKKLPSLGDRVMTLNQAAERACTSVSAISTWIEKGIDGSTLPATERGGKLYVHPDDLEAFLCLRKRPVDRFAPEFPRQPPITGRKPSEH